MWCPRLSSPRRSSFRENRESFSRRWSSRLSCPPRRAHAARAREDRAGHVGHRRARRRGRAGGAVSPAPTRARHVGTRADETTRECFDAFFRRRRRSRHSHVPAGVSDRRWEPPRDRRPHHPPPRASLPIYIAGRGRARRVHRRFFRDARDGRVHRQTHIVVEPVVPRRGDVAQRRRRRPPSRHALGEHGLDRQRHARDARPVRVRARVREAGDAPRARAGNQGARRRPHRARFRGEEGKREGVGAASGRRRRRRRGG